MNKQDFYNNFTGNWVKRSNTFYVAVDSAYDFIEHIFSLKVRLFGIDGFTINESGVESPIEWILDGEGSPLKKEVVEKYIKEAIEGNMTHFEFVLDL
jgi:hypothetical protein